MFLLSSATFLLYGAGGLFFWRDKSGTRDEENSMKDEPEGKPGLSRRKFLQTSAIAGAALSAPWIWTSRKAGAAPPGVIPTVKDPRFSMPVIDPRDIGPSLTQALRPSGWWREACRSCRQP
jgi:hypothetical protein